MHMTIAELAQRLFVSCGYARRLLAEGKMPSWPGPSGEPVVDRDVAEQYIAEAGRRWDKVMEEYLLVSAEQHEKLHFAEYMHVAQNASAELVVRVRCAYEAMYEAMRFVANMDGAASAERGQPDAFARAVVALAAKALELTPEESRQACVLNEWGLAGVPAEPPITADAAVRLAERVLAASFGSQGEVD